MKAAHSKPNDSANKASSAFAPISPTPMASVLSRSSTAPSAVRADARASISVAASSVCDLAPLVASLTPNVPLRLAAKFAPPKLPPVPFPSAGSASPPTDVSKISLVSAQAALPSDTAPNPAPPTPTAPPLPRALAAKTSAATPALASSPAPPTPTAPPV